MKMGASVHTVAAAFVLVALAACSSGVQVAREAQLPAAVSPSQSVTSSPPATAAVTSAGTVSVSHRPIAAPSATLTLVFAGLPAGTYPTHLHSACSGSPAFHITTLRTLRVDMSGAGSTQLPSSYAGRGLCVIVYSTPSLSRVLTTRRI